MPRLSWTSARRSIRRAAARAAPARCRAAPLRSETCGHRGHDDVVDDLGDERPDRNRVDRRQPRRHAKRLRPRVRPLEEDRIRDGAPISALIHVAGPERLDRQPRDRGSSGPAARSMAARTCDATRSVAISAASSSSSAGVSGPPLCSWRTCATCRDTASARAATAAISRRIDWTSARSAFNEAATARARSACSLGLGRQRPQERPQRIHAGSTRARTSSRNADSCSTGT